MSEATIVCAACRMEPFPADAPRNAETGLPQGWCVRTISGRSYTLCECCGDIRHFKGGVSSYLQENLGVAPSARLDSAESEAVGSGLHRVRRRG